MRILNTSSIGRVLSNEAPPQPYDPRLPSINLEKCRHREKKALEAAQQQAERVNAGVTTEAQCIFEALSKTLPCVWQDKTIVVLVSMVRRIADDGLARGEREKRCVLLLQDRAAEVTLKNPVTGAAERVAEYDHRGAGECGSDELLMGWQGGRGKRFVLLLWREGLT